MSLPPISHYAPIAAVTIQSLDGVHYPDSGFDPLDDLVSLTTHKALGEVSGVWTMVLVYRPRGGKTWADRINPMDYVTLSFGRYNRTPSVVMTGFVDNVRTTIAIDADGKPQRQIVVNGRDYGKILETTQIWFQPGQIYNLLEEIRLQEFTDGALPAKTYYPGDLVDKAVSSIGNLRMTQIQATHEGAPSMVTDAFNYPEFKVSLLANQNFTGSLAEFISQYENAPWCEFFVADRPSGPTVVTRWAPLLDTDGNPGRYGDSVTLGTPAPPITLSTRDIMAMDIGRTDNEMYTYFFTYATNSLIGTYAEALAASISYSEANPRLRNPQLNVPTYHRYGLRVMEIGSSWIYPADPTAQATTAKLNTWLLDVYGHNDILSNGTMALKGDERITIGSYVYLPELDQNGTVFYVEAVDHTYTPFETFTTQIQVTRGQAPGPRFALE